MNMTKDLNIWKKEEAKTQNHRGLRDIDISELSLSTRSFNSLKRANCNTVGDILDAMDEDGNGLRKIRNLGVQSEQEIKETLEELKAHYARDCYQQPGRKRRELLKPARTTMSSRIKDYPISNKALKNLQSSGIYYVQDLYRDDMNREPGWYAVRELFDQILAH